MTFLYQKSRCLIEAFSLHLKHLLLFLPTTMYEGSEILKNIIEEYKDQTMIFSIHQLELLEMMDKVIVMENGSIVFDGTYREYEANYGKE